MAVNIRSKDFSSYLVEWVNDRLQAKFTKIEDLRTGAAYCQFMDLLYPGSVPLERVKFFTNLEKDFKDNYKILKTSFELLSVDEIIPIEDLVAGSFRANVEFLFWFKRFFAANKSRRRWKYDARAARGRVPMGYGPCPGPTGSE